MLIKNTSVFRINNIPESPGVYLFKDIRGKVIYVGKSINLRYRIKSYFSHGIFGKTKAMVDKAKDLSFIVTINELDCLILESLMIKKYLPKYNILLKDDKNYLYIKITDEKYPRIITARKTDHHIKHKYVFGPFPTSSKAKHLLRLIRNIFPFSTHKPAGNICLNRQIGLCNPCPSEIERMADIKTRTNKHKEYKRNIDAVCKILSGKNINIKTALRKNILKYSREENYEMANIYKKRLDAYEYVTQKKLGMNDLLKNPNLVNDIKDAQIRHLEKIIGTKSRLSRIECFDIAHIQGNFTAASMVTFTNGFEDKGKYRRFKIKSKRSSDDISSMREVAARRFKHLSDWGRPDMFLVDGGIGQVKVFAKIFKNSDILIAGFEKRSENMVLPISPGSSNFKKIKLEDSPAKDIVLNLISEAHRFSRRYHHTLIRRSLLLK